MRIKKIIDDWYYNDLDPAVTIGEISRINLAKKITKYVETYKQTNGNA